VLSDTWFPINERTLATSIGATSTFVGSSAGFVAGPMIVGSPQTPEEAKNALMQLQWFWAIVSGIVWACCLVHYPARPHNAPSKAALRKRLEMKPASTGTSCFDLLVGSTSQLFRATTEEEKGKRFRFWLVVICVSVPSGVYQGWLATFHLSCPELNASQAGWLGCFMTLSGCAGSVAIGALLDRFNGRLKLTICSLLSCAVVTFAVFAAAAQGLTDSVGISRHDNTVILFAFGIAGGFFYNTTTPLFFEMAMETIYGWVRHSMRSQFDK